MLLIMHYGSLGGAERQGLGLAKFLTEEYQCEMSLLLTFSDELQPDFKLIRSDSLNHFVWIGRGYPYRWIVINKSLYNYDEGTVWEFYEELIYKNMQKYL